MTADAHAHAHAHRAIVMATVAGLLKPRRGLRIVTARADADARANADEHAGEHADATADVLVVTAGALAGQLADPDGLATRMARARALAGDAGLVAVVVASPSTRELLDVATSKADAVRALAATGRRDAYALALDWASARSDAACAPDVQPEQLAALVEAAAAAGLALVEPEITALAPALGRVRGMRSPRARALLATIALGASARPLLFVAASRAPRGGVARLKVERVADGWVAAAAMRGAAERTATTTAGDLVESALAILDEAARDHRPPLLFKELLREARERWTASARARGGRAAASSTDAADLAASLFRRAAGESVVLYALDPADPGWTLMTARL